MLPPKPFKSHPPESLLGRLDRAAAALNPGLALIAIGLVILNIVVVFSFVLPPGRLCAGPNPPACVADAAATPSR